MLAGQELYKENKPVLFQDTLVTNGSTTREDLIFTLIGGEGIIIAPSQWTPHFNPASRWSSTATMRRKWHASLEGQGLASGEFDYGKGVVLTSARNTLHMSFHTEETGSYDLFIRYLQSESGGLMKVWLDDEPAVKITTKSPVNAFRWQKIGSFNIGEGEHSLRLGNVTGFNAVNLFAFVDSEEVRWYAEQVKERVENKRLAHILEAEQGFYYQAAPVSTRYGGEASGSEVVKFAGNAEAQREIEILRDGDYQIAVRLDGSVVVSVDNQSYFAEATNLGYAYLGPVYLTEGTHRIKISCVKGATAYVDVLWLYSVRGESETLEKLFAVGSNPAEVVSYQKISATKHKVRVNAAQPFMLSFTEAYDPLWVARVNGKEYPSLPLYSVVNGFWVEDKGELDITITYKPQEWFYYGAVVSAASLLGLLIYIVSDWRRKGVLKQPVKD